VERLVRPTIEEPLRIEWENAQALSLKLRADEKLEAAREVVHAFHQKLCGTRVLDPACGSGNFLYVTLNLLKQIESEVLATLVDLGEKQEQLIRITPGNFRGIEVKPWGKEIAELVLWIGYLQWHYRTHDRGMPPPSPVLQDYGNIEGRDAVLAWDSIEYETDANGKLVTRWDGETMKSHSATGLKVPDDKARVPQERYVNARKSEWPRADFVVGNPPFVANYRMRDALGDGYVEALRRVWEDVPKTSDYVMYWWKRASELASRGDVSRFGLITTNSITQAMNRQVVERAMADGSGLSMVFAIPDHPWTGEHGSAAVRIAMTVASRNSDHAGTLRRVSTEAESAEGDFVELTFDERCGLIRSNLTIGPNVIQATKLRAMIGVSCPGVKLHGSGFIVPANELPTVGVGFRDGIEHHVRPYVNGRDITSQPRGVYVIDLLGLQEPEVRSQFPEIYQRLLERVKPERDQNKRDVYRHRWWLFGEARADFRPALQGLRRSIVTPQTMKHRYFVFVDGSVLADNMLTVFAVDDALALGVLSSRVHVTWALAAGGTLEDRPCYYKSTCFEPFPFPACNDAQAATIRDLGEQLDAHRKRQVTEHSDLTITGMYNVLEKLRLAEPLSAKEKTIHQAGLVSVLARIHDDLDAAVFEAYGWSPDLTDEQILEKLVALNAERAKEEEKGLVRWLRPDFQNPSGKKAATQPDLPSGEDEAEPESAPAPAVIKPWPKKIAEQIAAVRDRVAFPGKLFTVESVAAAFKGAKKKDIEGFLDGFAALGVLTVVELPAGKRWRAAGRSASI
jgi:hypothetical protein